MNAEFWLANKSLIYNEVSQQKSLYINQIKTLWWYWHIWSCHLSYAVIYWPTNSEASHSLSSHSLTSHLLTVLVQCNHHLVVLSYLKLPLELRSYFCVCTGNHSPIRHQPAFTKIAELPTVVRNIVPVQLFIWITQWSTSILSKYAYQNTCIKMKHFSLKY